LYTGDGPAYSGEVIFDNLRVPENIYSKTKYAATVLEFKSQKLKVPPRKINSHKGLHGHALIVGGDEGMGGAAIMAAEAALYSGAGLVSLLTHPSNVSAALSRKPEIMVKGLTKTLDLDRLVQVANCVVLGPGLGTGKWGVGLYRKLIKVNKPLVLDADGLNCLASEKDTRDNWILTPHPGEGKRLLGKDCQVDRISSVRELSRRYRATMVLKGPGTLISNSEGDVSLCPYGNPGMAAGGMGDILSGVIGALVAQGVTNYDSAKLGVVLHSFAADEIAREQGKIGLLATDLLLEIRRLLNA
jgi:NAD(P)H-hydrate epimerase